MRRLWIHIGHDKTGSSYLQALFARNLDLLAAQGIGYPVRKELIEPAIMGITTSGTEHGDDLEDRIAAIPDGQDVLLSYEGFFNSLAEQHETELARWRMWCDRFGFASVHVLLFTRNPIGHATSSYMQIVRAHGGTGPLDTYVSRYNRPFIVMKVLQRLQAEACVGSITVRNYSQVRGSLAEEVIAWLPVEPGVRFEENKGEVINRGLTDAEMIVTRWINKRSPGLGRQVAIQAQRSFPDLKPSKVWPSYVAQQQLQRKNAKAMAAVNQMAGDLGRYEFDVREPHEEDRNPVQITLTALRMSGAWAFARFKAKVGRLLRR